jgi:uncharacterized membrane protein
MSGILPNSIERWLGIQPGAGEGTVWSIELAWYWQPWMTLLLAIAVVAFVAAIYLREGPSVSRRYKLTLAFLRLTILTLAALAIAQISLSLKRTGLPTVAVVLDDSQSMTVADRYEDKTAKSLQERLKKTGLAEEELQRFRLAQMLLLERDGKMLRVLADSYKLRMFFLTGPKASASSDAKELADEIRKAAAAGEVTRLGAGIRGVLDDLRGSVPAAIVLLTDGVNTDGPPLSEGANSAQRRGVPLFCVGLGSESQSRDLKLSDLLVEDVAFVDDVVPFECKLTGTGFQGTKAAVTLREKDKNETLAKTEVTVGPDDQPQPVRLIYRPTEVGRFEYVVEVEPQAGESQTENNRQSHAVEVRKEKVRVLLAQAYPSYEFRYLRNLLERDETIELATVLQEADLEHSEQDKAALRVFPERKEDLFTYDVIILGDVNPALLSPAAQQSLAEFVDQPGKGGAVVMIAGPQYMPAAFRDTPLAKLMPFDPAGVRLPDPNAAITESFPVEPSDLGLALPPMQLGDTPEETLAIWQHLPPLYWLMETQELKPSARVLAEDPNRTLRDGRKMPVVIMQYVGAGKTLFHATDETWRWRFRTGDVYFARYWIQMIRYLSRSKLTESGQRAVLSTDRREYLPGEPVKLRVRFADERLAPPEDDGVSVVVEQAGRQTQKIALRRTSGRGTFEGTLDRPTPGGYHVWMAIPRMEGTAPAADFIVNPPAGEFAQTRMDAAALREAATATGGKYYTVENAAELLADLPPGRQVPIETLPPIPLWNRWPAILLFLALLIAEWVMRKRRGLV